MNLIINLSLNICPGLPVIQGTLLDGPSELKLNSFQQLWIHNSVRKSTTLEMPKSLISVEFI